MLKLRPSSFSRSWWKLEKIVRGRERCLKIVKIPHEGPATDTNGKGKDENLGELERTTAVSETEKPPC